MILFLCASLTVVAQDTLSYNVELSANVSDGNYAPLWFTANRYGLSSERPNSGYLRAGTKYNRTMRHDWSLEVGIDIAGTVDQTAPFLLQQAYADVSWQKLTLSIGSKERSGYPLYKNPRLTSGMMVEGLNARPIPQIRLEANRYINVPFTRGWVGVKGHLAYGMLTDGNWRADYFASGQQFVKNVLYHTKSLMLKFGNEDRFPLTMEIGLLDAAQFGGDQWVKNNDGTITQVKSYPNGLKSFLKALVPTQESTLENVEGNHVGSWNFALTYNAAAWKARLYYEHYFDDHSQMTWQYGRWKDGHIGFEVELPRNPYVSTMLWEGFSTYDQTGPILYDGVAGSFTDVQQSGGDNYFNHEYNWQHWGMALGHPFCPGPIYNKDRRNWFRSSRAKAQHVGLSGNPSDEFSYRVLLSFVRHWGTYAEPFDCKRHQFSSLYELTYAPKFINGWSFAVGCGLDRGNYLGNSFGGILTIKKTGICFTR